MYRTWFCCLMVVMLSACGQQSASVDAASVAPAPAVSARQAKVAEEAMLGGAEQSLTEISEPQKNQANLDAKRYIALRHHLSLEMPSEQMQANFDAAIKHCEALNCQILNATYNKQTPYSPPSASLSVRIPPRNVSVFLSGLAKNSEILQHSRDAEDMTNQVVDADARIQNLTSLRDRLRAMLRDKRAEFKEMIDIERELANTQSQLDSMQSMRKVLALETELVAVSLDFSAAQGITEQGFFAPVAQAVKEAGRVMMQSFATVITFVVSVIPWLLLGIPFVYLIRKYWHKIKS
jgi:hypothetical protein